MADVLPQMDETLLRVKKENGEPIVGISDAEQVLWSINCEGVTFMNVRFRTEICRFELKERNAVNVKSVCLSLLICLSLTHTPVRLNMSGEVLILNKLSMLSYLHTFYFVLHPQLFIPSSSLPLLLHLSFFRSSFRASVSRSPVWAFL